MSFHLLVKDIRFYITLIAIPGGFFIVIYLLLKMLDKLRKKPENSEIEIPPNATLTSAERIFYIFISFIISLLISILITYFLLLGCGILYGIGCIIFGLITSVIAFLLTSILWFAIYFIIKKILKKS